MVLCLLNGFKDVLAQPFATNGAVIAFDVGVLLRLAGLDIFKPHVAFFSLFHEFPTDVFRAVVHTNSLGLSAPLYDLVQGTHDTFSRQ